MKPQTIAFVAINASANLSKIRWQGRKLFGGSIADPSPGATAQDTYYEVLPYQYGLMRAYLEQFAPQPERYQFLEPCFRAASVEETAQHCAAADLIGFAVYLWNEQFNLAVSRRIKELNPDSVILFGGPQVPVDAGRLLRDHPWLDLACAGEGENSFMDVAEILETRNWRACRGIAWIDSKGRYHQNPLSFLSSESLAACRSPYESGTFEPLFSKYPEINWLMPVETNRGCPFHCAYCAWGAGHMDQRVRRFSMERIRADIDWAGRHGIEQVLVCDSNFGLLPRDTEIVRHAIEVSGQTGAFNAISIQSSCEVSERVYTIHEKLSSHGLSGGATIGVQSRSERVLNLCGRSFVPRLALKSMMKKYARLGIATYCDMILGLPEETYSSFASGIAEIIESGQFNHLFVYPFSPLVNTVMGERAFQRTHGLRTVSQMMAGTHACASEKPVVNEYMDIVVETNTLPAADWCRARAYLWLTQLLFYSRLLHIPMIIGIKALGLDFRSMTEAFLDADPALYPTVASVSKRCTENARLIQEKGAPEMIPAGDLENSWWPLEQYAIIRLVRDGRLDRFYKEAEALLASLLPITMVKSAGRLLVQAVRLNHALFRVPFVRGNIFFKADFNLKALYRGYCKGREPVLHEGPHAYEIIRTRPEWKTWSGWYDHLMFCHNQKTYYLYGLKSCKTLSDMEIKENRHQTVSL